MITKNCLICAKQFKVTPNRVTTARYCSNECRIESTRGRDAWNKGRTAIENFGIERAREFKNKISKALSIPRETVPCLMCGKAFSRKIGANTVRKFCGTKCSLKYRWAFTDTADIKSKIGKANKGKCTGAKNPNWTGGLNVQYTPEFSAELKEAIRHRDNYNCQICGMTEEEHLTVYGVVLSVHHIDYIKHNVVTDNLLSLCRQCHTRTNHNRKYWQEILGKKLVRKI